MTHIRRVLQTVVERASALQQTMATKKRLCAPAATSHSPPHSCPDSHRPATHTPTGFRAVDLAAAAVDEFVLAPGGLATGIVRAQKPKKKVHVTKRAKEAALAKKKKPPPPVASDDEE